MTNEATKLLRDVIECFDGREQGMYSAEWPIHWKSVLESARAYLSQAPAAEAPTYSNAQGLQA